GPLKLVASAGFLVSTSARKAQVRCEDSFAESPLAANHSGDVGGETPLSHPAADGSVSDLQSSSNFKNV
ncbi:hypothetical protein MHZ93_24235, partial [Roseomonas sp. ACRSG]|nr:hypothetical protein [Roseomonas sp. ACRSG]